MLPLWVALLAGAALPFAFSPINIYPLAIISPACLLAVWLSCSARQAFWRGFLFGLSFFGIGVSWVFTSIHVFGNASVLLASLITLIFVVILSLFIAAQGYVLAKFFSKNDGLFLAFPASWALFEWIRSWIFTGFPWLLLSNSQTYLPFRGFAPIVGEFGLSFIVSLNSSLLVYLVCNRKCIKRVCLSSLALIGIACAGFFLSFVAWTTPTGAPVQVSLIQGNLAQQLKWDPDYLQETLQRYYQLTQQHWDSQLIVWPEAAVPVLQNQMLKDEGYVPNFLDHLDQEAKQHQVTLITGIPLRKGENDYNSMLMLGDDHGAYNKRRLVIFGEYLPWWINWLRGTIRFFNIPMSNFSAGSAEQPLLIAHGLKIAPFICYEIVYPDLVRKTAKTSQVLLTINNDAWFGDSFALAQHMQIGQFQALATGRYLLFLSNTGLTALVTPKGKVKTQVPAFQVQVLTENFQPMSGSTPWMKWGDAPVIFLLFFLCVSQIKTNKLNKTPPKRNIVKC